MKLVLDEWVVREVIDTLYMARTTFLGITGLDSPQEVAKKSSENETAITRRISKAIDIIQQAEQPSLPEGLDEAALASMPKPNGIESNTDFSFMQMVWMFEQGAKWMAGQGVSIQSCFHKSRLRGYISFPILLEDGKYFNNGEEVIVQIRKAESVKKDWHEENESHGAFALTQDEIDFYYKK